MITITNRSKWGVLVASREFSKVCDPGGSIKVPPDVWAHCKGQELFRVMRETNLLLVEGERTKTPAANAPTDDDPAAAFAALHHRKAASLVSKMDDLDELELLHAAEERPGVKQAIEDRMKELI